MVYLLNSLILALMSLLSLSVFPHLKIIGVVPLLALFFVIALAYFRKGFEPFLLAAFAGIFFDLYSSYPFGFYLALFLFFCALIRFMFQEGMRTLSFWYFFAMSLLGLLIYYLFQIGYLAFKDIKITVDFLWPVINGLLVNSVFVLLLYPFNLWYFDRVEMLEDKLKRR